MFGSPNVGLVATNLRMHLQDMFDPDDKISVVYDLSSPSNCCSNEKTKTKRR